MTEEVVGLLQEEPFFWGSLESIREWQEWYKKYEEALNRQEEEE